MIVPNNPNYRLFQNRNKISKNKFHSFWFIGCIYVKGKKMSESRAKLFANLKQKVTGIKCLKVVNCEENQIVIFLVLIHLKQ